MLLGWNLAASPSNVKVEGQHTGPLNEEGERDPFRGLLVLVVIDTTPIIPFPRGHQGDLSGLP